MASQMGLGKGLQALIKETTDTYQPKDIHSLPVKDIIPNPHQPRRDFSEQALEELAESIQKQGLLQPILVRPLEDASPQKYEIVAGERRYRASKKAGLLEVPVVVRSFTDQETLTAALVENIQRENLNPMEEALALQTLKQEYKLSQEDLAAHLGKSRSSIANSLRLLVLSENAQADVAQGLLSAGHARALLSITDQSGQDELHKRILAEQLSVREAEGLAALWKEQGSFAVATPSAPEATPVSVPKQQGTENEQTAEHLPPSATIKRPQSAVLVAAQQRLAQAIHPQVKITGKETKGKITIPYTSQEEFERLLALLEHQHQGL